MQQVAFAWIVVEVLHEAPARVGTAQMVSTLPAVVFLLLGGAIADRFERRALLAFTHGAGALTALALVGVLLGDRLGFGVVLVYAAAWGTLHAIHLPARDAILFDVGQRALSRAVPATTLVQFAGQAGGNLLVGTATWLGAPLVLGIQSLLVASGVLPVTRLARSLPRPDRAPRHPLSEIRDGIGIVFGSSRLRSLTLLISLNGIFFIGPYFVLVPLLLRDHYGGGVGELSLLMMMFPLGTMTASTALIWLGHVPRRGQLHFAGQLLGALCLFGIWSTPSFPVLLATVFLWGIGGGAFLNMGRTLFLESAPESHRGRCLSVYTLALLGMAPIGTQLAGWVGQVVGPASGCLLAGLGMLVLLAILWIATPVRSFD
jgi:MFS family permease